MALVNPRLRPVDELVLCPTKGPPGQAILDAITAYYDAVSPAPSRRSPSNRAGGPFIEQAWKVLPNHSLARLSHPTAFAEMAGSAQVVRAAARACATNAAALFVPCHRIPRTDGSLGGFRHGLEIKRRAARPRGSGLTFGR